MNKNLYMGLDIGGTKISISFFSANGKFLGEKEIPTYVSKGPNAALERMNLAVKSFLNVKQLSPKSIRKIAVGCPGPFDKKTGRIFKLPNLHTWKNFPLVRELKRIFKVPVMIENDANLAALGEACFGAGRRFSNVLYITYSTGIGGGIVANREIYNGSTGDAFELGHITVQKDGKKCGCGKYGCLETTASGSTIEKEAKAFALGNTNTNLSKLYKKHSSLSVPVLLEAVRMKDKPASKIWNGAIEYFAIGVSNLIQIINPDVIVIGGGIAKSWDLLIKPLRKYLKIYTWDRPLSHCKIVKAKLANPAAWGGYKLLTRKN